MARTTFIERDFSGFTSTNISEIGAMVVKSPKGLPEPVLCNNDGDVLKYFGYPSAKFPSLFEAIAFTKRGACWIGSAVAPDAKWGGIDIFHDGVKAFSGGRINPANFSYESSTENANYKFDVLNGKVKAFNGVLLKTPVNDGTIKLKINSTYIEILHSNGVLTSPQFDGEGIIDTESGEFSFTFKGTIGESAEVISDVNLSAGVDLGDMNKAGYAEISSVTPFAPGVICDLTPDIYNINIKIDNGNTYNASVTVASGDTWGNVVGKLQTSLRALSGAPDSIIIENGKIKIMSATAGANSAVTIFNGIPGGGGDLIFAIDALSTYTATLEAPVQGIDVYYYVDITIDGINKVINLGNKTGTTRQDIINILNSAFGKIIAVAEGTQYIKISGALGSATLGNVIIKNPSSGLSGFQKIFASSGATINKFGINPTGNVPSANSTMEITYTYNKNLSAVVSHSFFARSPYEDDLVGQITWLGGKKFKLSLYQYTSFIKDYYYSLDNEADNFGKSLYIFDVFRNNAYVTPKINENYIWKEPTFTKYDKVEFEGGTRGSEPELSDYMKAWNYFQKAKKYPAKIFMDVIGNAKTIIAGILATYQYFAHGISCAPLGGSTVSLAKSARGTLNFDKMSFYCNHTQIKDPYNNSAAWINNIGSIGKKYAMMYDVFDGLSPAGTDENGHGGILNDWEYLDIEEDYSDEELTMLDDAQINPVIMDDVWGVMVYGDRTMQVELSDTSFIGHRRVYNYIIERITKDILRKQEFKNNDNAHRLKAKTQADSFLDVVNAENLFRELYVQCDEFNNDDDVLAARDFILDVFSKITPNSQKTCLRLTRLAQGAVIAEFIKK